MRPLGGIAAADDHPGLIEAKKSLADAESEVARLTTRPDNHNMVQGPRGRLVDGIEKWVREEASKGHGFSVFAGPPPKLAKGETVEGGVVRLQRGVRENEADIARTLAVPFPKALALQKAIEQIDGLANAGEPYTADLIEHLSPIEFATHQAIMQVHGVEAPGFGVGQNVDALGVVCGLLAMRWSQRSRPRSIEKATMPTR